MRILPLLVLSVSVASAAAVAQSLRPNEIYSSIAVRTLNPPHPVLGGDGHKHLAYELLVVNPSHVFVTLDKVEAVDPAGHVLASLDGDRLKAMTVSFAPGPKDVLPLGGSAVVVMDVALGKDQALPPSLAARITAHRQVPDDAGKPTAPPAGFPLAVTYTFTGAHTGIGQPAVVLQPPLRGDRWVAVNGCCDALTSHRGAVMAVDGDIRVPERFAIDFVQLRQDDRLFTGDGKKLSDYAYYGTPVHAAAAGKVVNLYDATDEQVPNGQAKGINLENLGGNMLVIDIGGGHYTFYAHLQRGSLKVGLGDHVKAGQVIGLVGNTGNSTAPHLHFHVMDRASPLDANGLPYVFTHFTSRGVAQVDGPDDPMEKGTPLTIDTGRLTGPRTNALPLNNEVVDFN